MPPAAWKAFTSSAPFRMDPAAISGVDVREVVEILHQVQQDARRAGGP